MQINTFTPISKLDYKPKQRTVGGNINIAYRLQNGLLFIEL